MKFQRPGNLQVAINVAPLVDVVFLLVIFFAVTTTFLETAGLELELPESSSTAPREPSHIIVQLTEQGELMLDGETVELTALSGQLSDLIGEQADRAVVLQADGNARHESVVQIMDAIRAAGARSMTVAARASE